MSTSFSRRTALLLGTGGLLAGCGFHPVYMPAGNGRGPDADLTAIDVRPMYERPGQIMREALLERLRIEPGQARRYDLDCSFYITGEALGVLSLTQATRVRMVGYANWSLMARDAKHTTLVSGSERMVDGLDIFGNQVFAADLDNEVVQRRLAKQLADRVALHLAVWFHQHPSAVG